MTDLVASVSRDEPANHTAVVGPREPSAGVVASYTPGPGSPEVILGDVLQTLFGLEPEAGA